LITLSLGVSSLIASTLADQIGPRPAVMIAGGIALTWAGIWWLLTRSVRRTPIFAPSDIPTPQDRVERRPPGAE
jgi:uncharacterized membrane protein YfbV (UPF0208 family)